MTAQQISEALHALWPHCDPSKTVDRVIAGDPQREAKGVAVCWMPYSSTLREAAERGANIVVAHEPTFFDHFELRNQPGHPRMERAKDQKLRLIDELGITILRCHDVWDAIPEVGTPFMWGPYLGLQKLVASQRYLHVYEIPETTALAFTQAIATRTAKAGQSTLEFYGDPDRVITKVGIGTGCCSEAMALYDLGADLAVSVDDIARAWIVGEYCNDSGDPLIVVNHGVSEDCAMESLKDAVQNMIPGIPVFRIVQGASYREVHAR